MRDASPEQTVREIERAAWRRSFGALLFALACWEVFLRIDSVILAAATKAWLFPLLGLALTSDGVVLGGAAGAAVVATVGTVRARRLRRVGFPSVVAVAIAFEYALVAYHHRDGRVDWRVLAALALGALVWSIADRLHARRRATAASASSAPALSTPARHRSPRRLAMLAFLATAAFALALTRPDVFYAILKRDSALGRVLGHGLAAFPPALAAAPPPAPLPQLPARMALGRASVVLLSIDALRADALTPYGASPDRSPRLAALARDALVFTDAYTQSPNSAPSMATVLTGLYPYQHRVRTNRLPLLDARPRLPETLAAAGYATAAFVTNPTFGEPFQFERGFATYRYVRATLGPDGLVRDSNDPQVIEHALAWTRVHRDGPLFLWIHLMAPHSPYIPPDDLRPDLARERGPWFNVWNMQAPEAQLAARRTSFDHDVYAAAYAAEVASADRLTGRLLDGLAAAGVLDDAHVIVLADHGEAFGESDVFGHGRSLDRAETRVPLLWRLPRARRAATITTTVQLADLTPTLLDLLGIAVADARDGRDVAGLVLGDAGEDEGFAFTEGRYLHSMGVRGLLYGGRTRSHTLWIDAGYPYTSAFDRAADPDERVRRRADASDPLYARVAPLARAAQAALAAPAPAVVLDQEQRERLRALGYAQ
ncbi:MAG: sulfatase [Deltaproteobacteria bacterium]|nr:sulfatase [Deltaproteobacteria bacterium]